MAIRDQLLKRYGVKAKLLKAKMKIQTLMSITTDVYKSQQQYPNKLMRVHLPKLAIVIEYRIELLPQ